MASLREGFRGSEAGAVGHLVEAIAEGLGPDLDRLEQDIMPRVARHSFSR
jgi:hypothetical protein